MASAIHARLDAHGDASWQPFADDARVSSASVSPAEIRLAVYEYLLAIEKDWRDFEQTADCTVF
jgi:hypothetical protein